MAYYSGSFANTAAGNWIAALDAYLNLNSHWTIYDASAGPNAKVYRCYSAGDNCDFYMKVDDNYVGYCIVELWEGWDANAHAGTGANLATVSAKTMDVLRGAGGWGLCVRDHNIIFIDYVNMLAHYFGQPNRYDTSKNIVIAVTWAHGATYAYNPLGYGENFANLVIWYSLFDENGNKSALESWGKHFGSSSGNTVKTHLGTYVIFETPVMGANSLLIGALDGVLVLRNWSSTLNNGDTVTLSGVDWVSIAAVMSTHHWCLIRKS